MLLDPPLDPISLSSTACIDVHRVHSPGQEKDTLPLVDSISATSAIPVHRTLYLNADFTTVFSYICQGYDPNARHFDGLHEVSSDDFLMDLDTDSMER